MNKDNHLMLEALQSKFTGRGPVNDIVVSELHKIHTALNQMATMIDLNPSDEVDQLLSHIRDAADMLISDKPAEDAENEPHGYPGGITAIQNLLINQLKKHGFTLTKILHADQERDKYPTVFMKKQTGPMHSVVEISGMGTINGEPYAEYLKAKSEDAESYNAMTHLTQAANEIRDILKSNADDEARTEHIINMAQLILGDKKDYTDAEYRKMLDGLIVLLNRFIVVPMN